MDKLKMTRADAEIVTDAFCGGPVTANQRNGLDRLADDVQSSADLPATAAPMSSREEDATEDRER